MNTTVDEMVHSNDPFEEVELDFEPDAFAPPLSCAECGASMERVVSTKSILNGQIMIEFEQYRCPQCGWERMTLEQARQLQMITHFFTQLVATAATTPLSSARVKPLTNSHFLVQLS